MIAEDAVIIWIDPERRTAAMRMGTQTGQRPDHFERVQDNLSTVLTYRAASETLSSSSTADSLQVLADAESEADGLSWGTIIISVLAGGAAMILVWALLNAAWQRYKHPGRRLPGLTISSENGPKQNIHSNSAFRAFRGTISGKRPTSHRVIIDACRLTNPPAQAV